MAEEKRKHPRVKAEPSVGINAKLKAQASDLSESGIGVNSVDEIATPEVALEINFPMLEPAFKAQARLVWKRDFAHEGFLYGFEFVGLSDAQKSLLRRQIIRQQLGQILEEIKGPEVRRLVQDFFMTDMLECMEGIIRINSLIAGQAAYSAALAMEFERLNNQVVLKGYCLDELLSHAEVSRKIRQHFRQLFGTWAYKSPIVRRALEKPRGYAGDYKLLEMIYDNNPEFSSGIGYYYDRYFLKSPYAVALRMRKDNMRDILARHIIEPGKDKVLIACIGCGPCRELLELLALLKTRKDIVISCVDWDEEALLYSETALLPIKPVNVDLKFIKEDLVTLMSGQSKKQLSGGQDIIYSMGIADYLPNVEFKALMTTLCTLLQPKGKLIITHKNREKTFPAVPPDWFCDWKFVSRNKEEVLTLLHECGVAKCSVSCQTDNFGYIYYFTLAKG